MRIAGVRPRHPRRPDGDSGPGAAEQIAGAHPGDALLGGVDAETVGIHVQQVECTASGGSRTDLAHGAGGVGGQLPGQLVGAPLPRDLAQRAGEHLLHHGAERGAVAQALGEAGPPHAQVGTQQLGWR